MRSLSNDYSLIGTTHVPILEYRRRRARIESSDCEYSGAILRTNEIVYRYDAAATEWAYKKVSSCVSVCYVIKINEHLESGVLRPLR